MRREGKAADHAPLAASTQVCATPKGVRVNR